jgi:hypothetical protein
MIGKECEGEEKLGNRESALIWWSSVSTTVYWGCVVWTWTGGKLGARLDDASRCRRERRPGKTSATGLATTAMMVKQRRWSR